MADASAKKIVEVDDDEGGDQNINKDQDVEKDLTLAGSALQSSNGLNDTSMFEIYVNDDQMGEFKSSRFFQFWVSCTVKGGMMSLYEHGVGRRTIFNLDSSKIGKLLSNIVGEKIGLPLHVRVEEKKEFNRSMVLHISLGK